MPWRRGFAVLLLVLSVGGSTLLAAPLLGDLNGDGQVDGQDLDLLDQGLGTSSGLDLRRADVDLDGRLDEGDRTVLAALIASRTGGGSEPVARFLEAVTGLRPTDPGLLQAVVRRTAELDHRQRRDGLELLLPWLERGGGRRIPRRDEPGGTIDFHPRDALALEATELLRHEAEALAQRAAHPDAAALDTADSSRQAARSLERLENVTADLDRPLQPDTVRWIRARLAVIRERIDDASSAPPPPSFTPATTRLPGPTPSPTATYDPQPPPSPTSAPKSGPPVGLMLLALAVTVVIGLVAALTRRRPSPAPSPPRLRESATLAAPAPLPPEPTVIPPGRRKPEPPLTTTAAPSTPPTPSPPPVASSASLAQSTRYRVLERLGGGGQGNVYKAQDQALERLVAIKMLTASSGSHLLRLLREASALAGLEHPGIPRVYDVTRGDPPYMVMELVDGKSLRQLLNDSVPDPAAALGWLAQLLDVLRYLHGNGTFHRDVKPSNIVVAADGRIRLIDFGLVVREDDTRVTREGDLVGTLGYLAPEQFGTPDCTATAELYSAGLVAIELLTGRYAFPSPQPYPPQVFQTPQHPRAVNPSITEAVDDFVMSLVATEPADRPTDAAEALRRLGELGYHP